LQHQNSELQELGAHAVSGIGAKRPWQGRWNLACPALRTRRRARLL